MTYLLDTNVWVVALRHPGSSLVARFQAASPVEIRVCSVVVAELRFGCLRSAKPSANLGALDALLAPYLSLPFDNAAAEKFAIIRRHLESLGTTIGPYDLQIAAIALANNCALVTHNTAEFSRVPGLIVEDWQTP
jgi:tRNA(fMet)-specific endonuclease VapC